MLEKIFLLIKKAIKFWFISTTGARVKRGLYQTSDVKLINADINGTLNILKKSSVADLSVLYGRGQVDSPLRIRLT